VTTPRIYLPGDMQAGSRYKLTDEDRKYLRTVLRLAGGDPILIFNGSGLEAEGLIDEPAEKDLFVKIMRTWPASAETTAIALAQSLPKSDKMDFILQKATELGTGRIIPFVSQRSVPRLSREKASARQGRWQKIAIEAARQCRRSHIPAVSPVLSFTEMLAQAPEDALRIILWEEETGTGIKSLFFPEHIKSVKSCFAVVGPEGGFTVDEITMAKERGFIPVSLGRHVLRTETASLAVLTIIQYELNAFFDLSGGKEA